MASKNKRGRPDVITFNRDLIDNLCLLRGELIEGSYVPGGYREHYIYEQKRRKISAAPFRDRVVHHALCNVIMPELERSLVDNTFANRTGKGTHRAVALCRRYARRYRWCMKLDVVKFFPCIDHMILKTLIGKKIVCPRTLALLDLIIDGFNDQEGPVQYFDGDSLLSPVERRRGLPIGNLTSQHFANLYLSPLDHFIIENLKIRGYVRYVDDFLLFCESKSYLSRCRNDIVEYLDSFRLKIHVNKAHSLKTESGISFLGYRVFPDHVRLVRENVVRARRRIKVLYALYSSGRIGLESLRASIHGWIGHAVFADTWRIREKVLRTPELNCL